MIKINFLLYQGKLARMVKKGWRKRKSCVSHLRFMPNHLCLI